MKPPISNQVLESFFSRVVDAVPDHHSSANAVSAEVHAESWKHAGLRPGDLVLLSLPNGKDLLRQFFGVLLAGGVPALVAPMTPLARLREMASLMGARAIGALRLPTGELGAERVEMIGHVCVAMLPPTPHPACKAGEAILLTSGTSGFASGCVFDFESFLLNAERHADAIGQRAEDTVLINLPLYFSFAFVAQAMGSLVRGSRLVIAGPPFHVPAYQQLIRDHSVTVSSITPVLVKKVLDCEHKFADSLRVLSIGGAPLAPDLTARLLAERPGRELYLTYGLTQAGPRVSTLVAHAEPESRYSSAGLPLAGTQVSLRDLGDGSGMKQLFVTSATVTKRLIGLVEGRPNSGPVEPGTVPTGDIFEQDEQGYLYFKGRLADFINRGGEKINLAAVRRVAATIKNVVSAKTVLYKNKDGSEDYDLELQMEPSSELTVDAHRLLLSMLRRADMPRQVRIAAATPATAHSYK